MTQFRMRHANGLEEVVAQMQRHFLRQPEQEPQPEQQAQPQAAQQSQQSQQSQQQQQQQQRQQRRQQPWDEQPREARLAELAAAQAVLIDAFNQAAGEGRDPVAAAAAAADAAVAASAADGSTPPQGPAAAPTNAAPAPEPAQESRDQQEQQQELERRQFVAFSYLSQLQQALAYQAAVHQWRRNKADPAARVRCLAWGLATMGACDGNPAALLPDGVWRQSLHPCVRLTATLCLC